MDLYLDGENKTLEKVKLQKVKAQKAKKSEKDW